MSSLAVTLFLIGCTFTAAPEAAPEAPPPAARPVAGPRYACDSPRLLARPRCPRAVHLRTQKTPGYVNDGRSRNLKLTAWSGCARIRGMKTIVWRPGFVDVRSTTSQQGIPITDSPPATVAQSTHDATAGSMQKSIPSTLVVADAGDVYAQILAYGGDVEVVVDTTLAPAVIPAGQVWAGFGIDPVTQQPKTTGVPLLRLRGRTANTTILVTDTAQILGIASMETIRLDCEARTVVPLTVGVNLRMSSATIRSTLGALVPCIKTPDGATLALRTDTFSTLDNTSGGPAILQMGSTTGVGSVLDLNTSFYFALATGVSDVISQATAAGVVNWHHDASNAAGYLAASCPALVGIIDTVF